MTASGIGYANGNVIVEFNNRNINDGTVKTTEFYLISNLHNVII